jgi:hypothetical protein
MDTMQKRLVIVLAFALSIAPLAARAALVGTPCDAAQLGMTKMDTDQESIIACLKEGSTYQWKSNIGDSGGRISCASQVFPTSFTGIMCASSKGSCWYGSGSMNLEAFNSCILQIAGGNPFISCAGNAGFMCANGKGTCWSGSSAGNDLKAFNSCLLQISTP